MLSLTRAIVPTAVLSYQQLTDPPKQPLVCLISSQCHTATFGIVGDDFVIVAADMSAARSIMRFKDNEDKIVQLDENKLLASVGPVGDRNAFVEYVVANVDLYRITNQIVLSTKAAASFTRKELATALRKNPYQVWLLMGGYDADGPSLYHMDYLASMHKTDKAAHGYGSHFILSVMDRFCKKHMDEEYALSVVGKCIHELNTRFIVNTPNWMVKIVDRHGVRVVQPVMPPVGRGEASKQPAAEAPKPVAKAEGDGDAMAE